MKRLAPYIAAVLVISFSSCGRKGPPTLRMYEPPAAPAALSALHREGGIHLKWSAPATAARGMQAEGHSVLRSERGGDFVQIAFTPETTHLDGTFKTGRMYVYKIAAKNAKGVLSAASNEVRITPRALPSPPEDLSFIVGPHKLAIRWASIKGLYNNVYKSTEPGRYGPVPINAEPVAGGIYNDALNLRSSVFYTVRALRGGAAWDEGPASSELAVTPADYVPSAPKGLTAVATEETVVLIWDGNPEPWARGYRVMRAAGDKDAVYIGSSQTPTFTDTNPPDGKLSYSVSALGPITKGPPSKPAEITQSSQSE